jgi:4-hydroxy-tetrahydrodipicolinate reductase
MTKIGIVGCAGRMGQMLVGEVLNGEGLTLAGGTERRWGSISVR